MKKTVLSYKDVSLYFNKICILKNINLNIKEGEFRVLLGGNGSGKTSIVHLAEGFINCSQYSGTIYLDGYPLNLNNPEDGIKKKIYSVQQDSYLFDELSVADNLLCNYLNKGFITKSQKRKKANEILKQWGVSLEPKTIVNQLNFGEKRILELLRLTIIEPHPRILILDEPLNNVDDSLKVIFYNILSHFINTDTSIIYITHCLEEIIQYCNTITTIRDGEIISTFDVPESSQEAYKRLWLELSSNRYPKIELKRGNEVLCVENLGNGFSLKNISFSLHKREILGITGNIGAGKSILAKTLFGLITITEGKIYVDSLEANIQSVKDAIDLGIAYITDDRINAGLFLELNALDNAFSLGTLSSRGHIRTPHFEQQQFNKYSRRLNLLISHYNKVYSLSGGEQQKLLLLKWFMTSSKIFIFDEPTCRLDIPSKIDIYNLFNDLLMKDASIIICGSDLEELTGLCDRILVLNNGRITYEASRNSNESFSNIYKYIEAK